MVSFPETLNVQIRQYLNTYEINYGDAEGIRRNVESFKSRFIINGWNTEEHDEFEHLLTEAASLISCIAFKAPKNYF